MSHTWRPECAAGISTLQRGPRRGYPRLKRSEAKLQVAPCHGQLRLLRRKGHPAVRQRRRLLRVCGGLRRKACLRQNDSSSGSKRSPVETPVQHMLSWRVTIRCALSGMTICSRQSVRLSCQL